MDDRPAKTSGSAMAFIIETLDRLKTSPRGVGSFGGQQRPPLDMLALSGLVPFGVDYSRHLALRR